MATSENHYYIVSVKRLVIDWIDKYAIRSLQKKKNKCDSQGRSQNLKEVPQNFTEVFNIDDVTANDAWC